MSGDSPVRGLAAVWNAIEKTALNAGAVRIGAADLRDPHVTHFEKWLDEGLAAGMTYLHKNLPVRKDPSTRYPDGQSAVVVLVPYGADRPSRPPDNIAAHIARYAQGDDYHDVVDSILREIESTIKAHATDAWTWRYVDTGPLSDRSLAEQAGLGWIGRNGMLIDPEIGSWHFIGVLLTSLENDMSPAQIMDRCGDCTACVTECPTDAIIDGRLVDSNLCLSYLTIEHRGAFPDEMDLDFADNIFGCDICQEVCPWNASAPPGHPAFETRDVYRNTPVSDLLRMSQSEFSNLFRRSAVKRARRAGMIRNVIFATAAATDADLTKLTSEDDEGIVAAARRRSTEKGR